jgi:hypothetical protein
MDRYGQNWYTEQRLARQARASPDVSTKALEQGREYVDSRDAGSVGSQNTEAPNFISQCPNFGRILSNKKLNYSVAPSLREIPAYNTVFTQHLPSERRIVRSKPGISRGLTLLEIQPQPLLSWDVRPRFGSEPSKVKVAYNRLA